MITTLLLALAPLAPQSEFDAERWQFVDGVALHLDDRVVLFSDLERAVKNNPTYQPGMPAAELEQLRNGLIREFANLKLEIQAGRNEGFDPDRIAQIAAQQTNNEVEKQGAANFADLLRAQGATVDDRNLQRSDNLYSQLWRSKQQGTDLGFTERSSRDRYIRPGMLKSIFRVSRDMINPGSVELRYFVLDAAAMGGDTEVTREWLEDIQTRVASGEDFGQIITAEASQETANAGLQPPQLIPRIPIPELRRFAAEAEVGSFSPIIQLPIGDGSLFLLARLEDRVGQPEPDFEDGALQNDFRSSIEHSVDARLIGAGHNRLRNAAYIWIHPALRSQPQPERP